MSDNFARFIGDGSLSRSRKGDSFSLVRDLKDIKRGTKFLRVDESEALYPLILRKGDGDSRVCLFNEEHGHVVLVGDSVKIDTMFTLLEKADPPKTKTKPTEVPKKREPVLVQPQPTFIRGETGPRGEMGPIGFPGERGAVGDMGATGATGAQGIQGATGATGARGATGAQGMQGSTGATGATGARGEKGERGERGERGEKGDKGDPGEKGERGIKGLRGERGPPGLKGERGSGGVDGEKGERGEKGDRGERGLAGQKGDKGDTGLRGEKGDKGDKGDPGESPIIKAEYPLVLSQDNVITLDSKNLLERLQKVFAPLANPNFDLTKFDWLAASGGGVGVKWNGNYVRSTINDIDFRGNGISVRQAGGGVVVDLSGLVAAGGAGGGGVTADVGVMYLKGNTAATPIGAINARSVVEGNYQTGILHGFTKDAGTNSLRYIGEGGRFHVVISFNFYEGNQNTCGFYIGCNRDISSGLSADADRISESEVYANSSNPSSQPIAATIQTVIDLNKDDRLFMIAQNKDATTSITVEFMKMVVAPITRITGGYVQSINGLSGPVGISAGSFIEITQSGNTLTISGSTVVHGGVF